jgi:hypothetical protein
MFPDLFLSPNADACFDFRYKNHRKRLNLDELDKSENNYSLTSYYGTYFSKKAAGLVSDLPLQLGYWKPFVHIIGCIPKMAFSLRSILALRLFT